MISTELPHCNACGKKIGPNAPHCPACGEPFADQKPLECCVARSTPKESDLHWLSRVLIGVGIFIWFAVVSGWLFLRSMENPVSPSFALGLLGLGTSLVLFGVLLQILAELSLIRQAIQGSDAKANPKDGSTT